MKNIHTLVFITIAIINATCIHNPLFYYINIIYTVNYLQPCTIARNGAAMASLHLQIVKQNYTQSLPRNQVSLHS